MEGGEAATELLLSRAPDITAIFYASDLMALGGMRYLHRVGKRIPEDVAVVGYDNVDVAEWSTPALTTVSQRRFEMGVYAADMLIGMLQRDEEPGGRLLPSELVVRQST